MYEMTDMACSILPKDKPRYLMGVTPSNLLENSIELTCLTV